jgi:hypothetical protein
MIAKVKSRGISRVAATAFLALALGLGTLTACSGAGAKATCEGTSSCTVTFDRTAEHAKISVLGVTVQLDSVNDQAVTLSVGDRKVTVSKGDGVNVGKIHVTLEEITSDEIVIKATRP